MADREKKRVASGANKLRMEKRRRAAGMVPREILRSEAARRARAKHVRHGYAHHRRLRTAVNSAAWVGKRYEEFKRKMLAKYHADPENWSSVRKRRRIFERDGWRCRVCGVKVSDKLPVGHSRKAIAMHIVAAATGGEWSEENIATGCHSCNRADGVNKIPIQVHLTW